MKYTNIDPSTWTWFYKQAKARVDLRVVIGSTVPLYRQSGGRSMGLCPFHRESTASFVVSRDKFICYGCHAKGDLFTWLQAKVGRNLSKREALREAARLSGLPLPGDGPAGPYGTIPFKPHPQGATKPTERREWARKRMTEVLRTSLPADAPDAGPLHRYLHGRGLSASLLGDAIRYHPGLPYYHYNNEGERLTLGVRPAMLAKVTGPNGELVTLHCTYLTPEGGKLQLLFNGQALEPRKMMNVVTPGATTGAAIRLFEPDTRLVVAEGIETALAYHQLTGLPVWSCLNTHGLKTVTIPESVKEVIIAADRDANGAGLKAAEALGRRLLEEGRSPQLAMPPDLNPGRNTDWNDVVLKGGEDEF